MIAKQSYIVLVILLILSSQNGKCQKTYQYDKHINLFSYSKSNRIDSLIVLKKRLLTLLHSRREFEKKYIYEKVVMCPVPKSLFDSNHYYIEEDINNPKYKHIRKELKKLFSSFKKVLKRKIKEENKEYPSDRWLRKNIDVQHFQNQNALIAKERLSSYKVLLAPEDDFSQISEDPRYNIHNNFTTNRINQLILGFPVTIDGFVNSINYKHQNFNANPLPSFVEHLIEENLKISIEMVLQPDYRQKVRDAKVVTKDFRFSHSLWINTNTVTKEIFVSPYLIRAIFNQAYYRVHLLKFLEVIIDDKELQKYLKSKRSTAVSDIDSVYYGEFVNEFSTGLQFVLGHELAHIYLKGKDFENLELACDCNSAINIINSCGKFYSGVFRSMIIYAASGGEISFWGSDIDIKSLLHRSEILESMYSFEKKPTINSKCLNILEE